jgi:hypothetical protein
MQEQNARLIQQLREKIRFETSDPITKKLKFLIPNTAYWYPDPCEMWFVDLIVPFFIEGRRQLQADVGANQVESDQSAGERGERDAHPAGGHTLHPGGIIISMGCGISVPDVFGPPGSRSFHQQAKKIKKNLDFNVL